jgi:hypothetical protein
MKNEMFDELVESIKEATEIVKGTKETSRKFEINSIDIKKIRIKYK